MPYQEYVKNTFKQDLKAFKNTPAFKDVKAAIIKVLDNPEAGEPMVGNMAGILKVSFYDRPGKKKNQPYLRLLYKVKACCDQTECEYGDKPETTCDGVIILMFVKTREDCNNLYSLSKSYFDDL